MRIGNGPRLVVPRPGQPGRRGWYGQWRDRGQAYDLHREQERARLRRMANRAAGDRKSRVVYLDNVGHHEYCRKVDEFGRSVGPRLTRDAVHLPGSTQVRRVARQEEDLHSRMSRMLKAAHRFALRTE